MAITQTGMSFGRAVCEYLKLDPANVSTDYKITHGPDEVFGVTIHVALDGKDIEAIGKLMAK